jgi:Holliday junction resolvasome RuvABC DNA-binding subunit
MMELDLITLTAALIRTKPGVTARTAVEIAIELRAEAAKQLRDAHKATARADDYERDR